MSVVLHGAVDWVDRVDPGSVEQPRSRRGVVLAAVVATLASILGPLAAAGLWSWGASGDSALTPVARQVLDRVPGAYATDGTVVVPATGTVWTNAVPPDRVDGKVVPLAVDGLAAPGYLPYGLSVPAWLADVQESDDVLVDVGNLAFACTRWPGADGCTGSLLVLHQGERFIFRSGLHLQGPEQVYRFKALELGQPTTLALGALPDGAVSAVVSLEGRGGSHRALAAMSERGAVGGATLWWLSGPADVREVTFLDGNDQLVGTAR